MTEQEPEPVMVPEASQEGPARNGIVRRLLDWMFSPWMKDQSDAPHSWQQDAHVAFLDQQLLRARSMLYGQGI